MNIRKSALITVITVFLGCVFATQALAKSCNLVEVHISKQILNNYVLSMKDIVLNNGKFVGCKDENDMSHCSFREASFFGPDFILPFKRKTDGQIASIRVQQNYCVMEAGNITVQPIRGKWVYRTQEGSVGSFENGNVWLEALLIKSFSE
ncbi:MAG: hypothetical protein LPH20_11775 [Shewanella sp.]|nr:hypothetical protein [Shewanella sp.]